MPKRTYQPNNRRRAKTHGFRTRMKNRRWTGRFVSPPRSGTQEAHRQLREVVESQVSRKVYGFYDPRIFGECTITAAVTPGRSLRHFTRVLERAMVPKSGSQFRGRWVAPWFAIVSKDGSARPFASGLIG